MAVDVAHELAILERQRAYFASDEHLRDRAAIWRDATPEECLLGVAEQCAAGEQMLALMTPAQQEGALRRTPLPEDTVALLEAMQR